MAIAHRLSLLLLPLVLGATPVLAGGMDIFMPVSLLSDACRSEDPAARGLCAGYVAAVADALARRRLEGGAMCAPPGTPLDALIAVVRQRLRDEPTESAQPGFTVAAAALGRAFPCNSHK